MCSPFNPYNPRFGQCPTCMQPCQPCRQPCLIRRPPCQPCPPCRQPRNPCDVPYGPKTRITKKIKADVLWSSWQCCKRNGLQDEYPQWFVLGKPYPRPGPSYRCRTEYYPANNQCNNQCTIGCC